jgi:hypothetical protein
VSLCNGVYLPDWTARLVNHLTGQHADARAEAPALQSSAPVRSGSAWLAGVSGALLPIGASLPRAASKVDEATVYHLKVRLYCMKLENQQAVDSALMCLRGFSIDMPAHPTQEQIQAEYETVWQTLNGRPFGGEFPVRSHAERLSLGQLFSRSLPLKFPQLSVESNQEMFFSEPHPTRRGSFKGPRCTGLVALHSHVQS